MDEEQQKEELAMYVGKYTTSKSGRATFGGWSKKGKGAWKDLKDEIAQRYDEHEKEIVNLQKAVLKEIQENLGNDADEPSKKKRKVAVFEEEQDDVAEFSEDESDEEEEV